MKVGKTSLINLFLIFILLFSALSCKKSSPVSEAANKQSVKEKSQVLQKILEKKKLKVVVDYNSTNYFVYK
ncbi:MAG: hypothetical protein HQ541_17520, partial [Mariniphaga sp.]|nr:hypothetical protein [Mariniphaga sp.]